MAIPLHVDASTADDPVEYEGRQVVATGTLQGHQLNLESLAARPHEETPDLSERRDSSRRELRSKVEAKLMEQGALLDAWEDPRAGRRIALAVDVTAVSTARAPLRAGLHHH